jgi:hypothetical protein
MVRHQPRFVSNYRLHFQRYKRYIRVIPLPIKTTKTLASNAMSVGSANHPFDRRDVCNQDLEIPTRDLVYIQSTKQLRLYPSLEAARCKWPADKLSRRCDRNLSWVAVFFERSWSARSGRVPTFTDLVPSVRSSLNQRYGNRFRRGLAERSYDTALSVDPARRSTDEVVLIR